MTTLEDHQQRMREKIPVFLHGTSTQSLEAAQEISSGIVSDATYAWTFAQMVTIAADAIRLQFAPVVVTADGDTFFGFTTGGEGTDPAGMEAMRIIIAAANGESETAATFIRALVENDDATYQAETLARVASLTRQFHQQVCGETL